MNIQDVYEIWLHSKTRKGFMEWLKSKGLTPISSKALILIDFDQVDLKKVKK